MDPAFDWWVPHTLKNRNRIIAKVKSKYWLKTQKFGVKVPNNTKQAIEFDHENGNTLWWDAVCQKMNVRPAFEPWEKPDSNTPPGYQDINCNLIFDINIGENFRQKDCFVAGGHIT